MRTRRARRRRRRRSVCASPPTPKRLSAARGLALTHTMDSISRDSPTPKRPKTSDKRPWDSPGAFSYAVYEMKIPLEGSLAVFLGYVFVLVLSLFDFRANAALIRLSVAFRLSQTGDFPATPRLSAALVESLPRRLSDSKRLPATPRLQATLRLSATFDFRPAGC